MSVHSQLHKVGSHKGCQPRGLLFIKNLEVVGVEEVDAQQEVMWEKGCKHERGSLERGRW